MFCKEKSEDQLNVKLCCKCRRCSEWDLKKHKQWICKEIECFCEQRVIVRADQEKNDSRELDVVYECEDQSCGFKIGAYDVNFSAYHKIIDNVKQYMFFHDRPRCLCGVFVRAVVERVTVGCGVTDPTREKSIDLNNEYQLLFICDRKKCTYRKSVPQIIYDRGEKIKCVCNASVDYDSEKKVFSCARRETCGVRFHEMDSLTYIHTEQEKTSFDDHAWMTMRRRAPDICGKQGILKYRLNDGLIGELLYECNINNTCRKIVHDTYVPMMY